MSKRRTIPATQIIAWVDAQVVAATKDANKPNVTQQTVTRLAGRLEAMLDVKQLCLSLVNPDNDPDNDLI